MQYNIRELESKFKDFDSSELILLLVADGYVDELTEEEIIVSVDELDEDQKKTGWSDSAGYPWAKQLHEAEEKRLRVFSVADRYHVWYMGLVREAA